MGQPGWESKGTIVENLTEESVRDWDHMMQLLSICEAQRQIGETSLNETSSRSQQIIRLMRKRFSGGAKDSEQVLILMAHVAMVLKNSGTKRDLQKNSDFSSDLNSDISKFSDMHIDLNSDMPMNQRHKWRHDLSMSQFYSDILWEVVILVAMYSDVFSQVAKICDSFTATKQLMSLTMSQA
ncbi:kinesin motor domain-containing protein [Artemisia annua]|uniref:Kinesin motor domain-containing protein n=1 Tax=Artemisia annua TaxID=35608 RepID=A0A2U1LA04_ARTAN|nr:kinesin motor domain-containing protein [Artemisia annua]